MAFEGLTEKLQGALRKLSSKGKLTEDNVKEGMREVRMALLEADVSYKVVKDFVKTVSERAVGAEVLDSLTPAQQVIKIVNEELTALMGGSEERLKMPAHPPAVIMMCGLQGAGKTTHSAKLAKMLKSRGSRPLLVAGDIYRPAAIKQLQVVGAQAGVPVFEMGTEDPVKIAQAAVRHARDYGNDYVIIDTAGRLQIDESMMQELVDVKEAAGVTQTLLVVDAMTGQEAVNVATTFNDRIGVDGVILTKLDGDTRGGAALSIRQVTGKPILYIGMGEKLSDLEQFYPDRMASRILGMGDVMSLIEKVEAQVDAEKAKEMEQKLRKASFDLNDYLDQMEQMKSMGGLSKIMEMLPGMGMNLNAKNMPDMDESEKQMEKIQAIIRSMTMKERTNPDIINASRKNRIAKGAGVDVVEVNRLLKQFDQSRKLMKQMPGMMGMGGKRGKKGRMRFPF